MAESKIARSKNNWIEVWTNPNPNSAFANNQSVNVDLSKYSDLCFEIRVVEGSTVKYYAFTPILDGVISTMLTVYGVTAFQRGVVIDTNTNTINLGSGCVYNTYGTRTENAAVAVPLRIFAR